MWHIGIDLHRHTVVIAAVNDTGQASEPVTHSCRETEAILETVTRLKPFRAVIEATATYRWLYDLLSEEGYDLLSEEGTVLLAHPAKLRLMTQRRAKTDKLDCQLLANLLRINQIPFAYIPPKSFHQLREITRQPVPNHGRLADRSPRAAGVRVCQEPRFVEEDERGSDLPGLFSIRGQSPATQASIAGWLRSKARRFGFCADQPSDLSSVGR